MTIQTLSGIGLERITDAFNRAFSDYFVPMHLSSEQLRGKMDSEGVDLGFSAGAFDGDQLAGLILHGVDTLNSEKTAYNAGTGVVPGHRGHGLTARLYDFILPVLKEHGFSTIQLEVIQNNAPAIRSYEKVGFAITNELPCYKGKLALEKPGRAWQVTEIQAYDWPLFRSFWDWPPSWQNACAALDRLKVTNKAFGVFDRERLAGYLILNPQTKRIQQFAVDRQYRRQGVATALFGYVAEHVGKEVTLINLDGRAAVTLAFLQKIGLTEFLRQYEMKFVIR